MERFVFVILHYNAISETINCVESITKNIDAKDYTIIIVDNGSPNDTGKQLHDTFKNNPKIVILLNKENLGFAKGNNTGFNYAKKYLNPHFIIMLNNDTLIMQKNFCKTILDEYNNSHFAVMGPQIHGPNGISSQNPGKSFIISGRALWKMTALMVIKFFLATLYLDFLIVLIQRLKNKCKKPTIKKNLINNRIENVILHGCCLIFSKEYIDIFDGLDSRTFLYMEEEILYLHIKTHGLLTVYNPELVIYHLEDVSINSVYSKPHKKKLFLYKNGLKSLSVYKTILHENGL